MEVFDLTGRKVAAIPADGPRVVARFEASGTLLVQDGVEVEEEGGSSMIHKGYRVRRYDPSRGTIEELSHFAGNIALPLSNGRALVRPPVGESRWQVVDVTSGQVTLEMSGKRPVPLSDGRWAFLDESRGVLKTTDEAERPVDLSEPTLIGELAPGLLLVWSKEEGAPRFELQASDETHVVEVATGQSVASWKATRPVLRPGYKYGEPGSPSLSLVETDDGLRKIDAATLELVPVLR
ncbi:MAG: hypothetical protein ABR517_04725 [Thermoanaerobaculia bacterium]